MVASTPHNDPGAATEDHTPVPDAPSHTRLSVNITESTATAINEFAAAKGVTITEALRRLVAYGNVVFQADRAGKKVLLTDDRETERMLLAD